MKSKAQFRESALKERQALTQTGYLSRNQSLNRQLLTFIEDNHFKSIHFFLAITKNNEPDFTSLFPRLWELGRKVMVSRTDLQTKTMIHYWLEPSTKLTENKWGIPEPVRAKEANLAEAELIVVPLLLADKLGNRLGYGGGYYDRLLKDFKGHSVGISLLPPIEELPQDPWDVRVHEVLFYS